MFSAYQIGVSIHLANHVSAALSAITRDMAKTDAEAMKLQKRIASIGTGLKNGLYTAGAGIALAAMFKPAITEAMKFERAMLRLKDIGGIDAKTLGQVRTDALSGSYKGIAAAESVDLFRDLHAAFGEAHEAAKFMPLFAGMARVTQGKYGKSAVAGEEDVKALAKVAERRGGTTSSERMESAMDLSMKIQNASGGAVTPKDLLAFMNRMGAMGNIMNNDGIMKMWALMQEQGGSKAGTALNSAMQNMVNGRGTEGSGFILRKMGWVDDAKNEQNLRGIYGSNWSKHQNKVTADALVNVDGAKGDMVGWMMSTGIPKINSYLDKLGILDPKKRDEKTVSLIAQGMSNRMGADSIALIATQLPRIMKDYHIAESSKGLRASVASYDESNVAKFQELHAKFETAMVNLGISSLPVVIPLVNKLASAFKTFNDYAEKNPETVARVTKGIIGFGVALIALGTFTVLINGIGALGIALTALGTAVAAPGLGGLIGLLAKFSAVGAAGTIGYGVGTLMNDYIIDPLISKKMGYEATFGTALYDKLHPEKPDAPKDESKRPKSFMADHQSRNLTIHNTMTMDGRVVAQNTAKHLVNGMRSMGPSGIDPHLNQLHPNLGAN